MLEKQKISIEVSEDIKIVADDLSGQMTTDDTEFDASLQEPNEQSEPEFSRDPDDPLRERSRDNKNDWQSLLPERFELLGTLGIGGMSTVLKVRDRSAEGKVIALKILLERHAADPKIVARFLKESELVSRLDHPGIVKILGRGTLDSGLPYMELELVEGQSLARLIAERGHLNQYEVTVIATQIATALEYARKQRIIHRDLKPANILIQNEGSKIVVKVVDFGIAGTITQDVSNTAGLTRTGDIFGSPAYMSPEQCEGGNIDTRSDIYSLGCMMYEMLTGYNPFYSDNPLKSILKHIEIKPEPFALEYSHLKISAELEAIVRTCLEKQPEKRYRNPGRLAKKLRAVIGTQSLPSWSLPIQIIGAIIIDGLLLAFGAFMLTAGILPGEAVIEANPPLWLGIIFLSLITCNRATVGKGLMKLEVADAAARRVHLPTFYFCGFARLMSIVSLCFVYSVIDQGLTANHLDSALNLTIALIILLLAVGSMEVFMNWAGGWKVVPKRLVVPESEEKSVFRRAVAFRAAALIGISLVVSCVSYFACADLQKRINADPTIAKTDVIYAATDISENEIIPGDLLVTKRILKRRAPTDAATNLSAVVGMRAKYGISKGSLVTENDLTNEDADAKAVFPSNYKTTEK